MTIKTISVEYATPRDAAAAIATAQKEVPEGSKIVWVHTEAPHPTENKRTTYLVTIDFDVPAA